MVRRTKTNIGEIVDKQCKTCHVVMPMRFDGLTICEEDLKALKIGREDLFYDSGNYTCSECRGTFTYKTELVEE